MHPVCAAKSILDQSWLFQTPFLPPRAGAAARSSALEDRPAPVSGDALCLGISVVARNCSRL